MESDPAVHRTSFRTAELSFCSKNEVTNRKLATSGHKRQSLASITDCLPTSTACRWTTGSQANTKESGETGQGAASVFCEEGAQKSEGKAGPKHYVMRLWCLAHFFSPFFVVIAWYSPHVRASCSALGLVAFVILSMCSFQLALCLGAVRNVWLELQG